MDQGSRRRSAAVAVVLLSSALAACERAPMAGDSGFRDQYRSKADCEGDWKTGGCEELAVANADGSHGGVFYYGPWYHGSSVSSAAPSSHSMGLVRQNMSAEVAQGLRAGTVPSAPKIARAGFGSTGRAIGAGARS